ncbi:hypothetical protein RchiOBHm_Chr2g0089581 [Rosa chinensis]|uniref:Uncharacterized protein n=1 Tax=Rosa chinensis TaxID=74649 RepID=A0A2P6RJ76_ROSCH|nr:hypothetical protein RchiOBHm_Chr2g0089581 [Rosa chinensis]
MKPENLPCECLCNLSCYEWVRDRNEMGKLREAINHHHGCIVSMRIRQSFHKVHGDVFPCILRYREWLQKAWGMYSLMIFPLALITGGHIEFYLLPHSKPSKVAGETSKVLRYPE